MLHRRIALWISKDVDCGPDPFMRIPKHVIQIADGPAWAHAGTRDASLVPHHHVTWGLRVMQDGLHVEALIPHGFVGKLRENLADNGRLALTVGEPKSHETYQLKGFGEGVREPTDDERTFQARWAEILLRHLAAGGTPEHLREKMKLIASLPSTYVRLRVEEIYVQTPGPTAGQRIAFEDEGLASS
jgi:hypothetical protein